MESKRGNEKVQYQGKGRLLKRYLTFMLAVMVMFTSIPLNMAWADELPYFEQPGDDEIELNDSVEEGDLSDIDLDISHTISKKGDKAVVTVSAAPSELGQENGVTKVTKVEIHQNGKLKKGKRSDGKWEFTVKENGVYSFVIYYNGKDGEDMLVASPSEIEKVEPTTEAEPQTPGANVGGAGGAGGGGITQPGENPDQEVTTPETEEGTNEDDKNNGETIEGDSNQSTSNEPEQKPSDNSDSDGKEEGTGDTTENQGGTDSSEQTGNADNSTSGDNTDTSTGEGNSDSSSSSDNNSDTSSDDNDSNSSDNSSSGSSDNGGSDSSAGNNSGSSDSSSSDSSSDSGSGSSDSGSSDNGGSDEGSDSSGTSIALNVIDFIFPVIEAQASDFTVKKAVIVEYEITNLFPEGDPEDVDVDIFDEPTEEGAMITLLVEPSEIGLEKGVREITDITLIDFEPEEDSEIIDGGEISTATDSEAEEEFIEEEEEIEEASPSDATYDTSKSSSAKHAEYQASESEEGEYQFFVKENGTYTFSIRYGRAADLDFEDSTELVETQFSTTYELDSIERGVRFTGMEDITIQAGEAFDLMEGVSAVSDIGMELPVVVADQDGFDPTVPGTYTITYAVASRSALTGGTAERTIMVNPIAAGDLSIVSDIHGTEAGKTLEVKTGETTIGMLSVAYDLPVGMTNRVLKIAWPEGTSATYPTDNITDKYVETIDGIRYTCLKISDSVRGQITFDIRYQHLYNLDENRAKAYLLAVGELNLGKIHVISTKLEDSGETTLAEASIGDFTTKKMEEGSKPSITYDSPNGYNPKTAPYNYVTEMDASGHFLKTPSLAGNGISTSQYFWMNIPYSDWGYKPIIVQKIRVYAPTSFDFEIDAYDQEKGVIGGTDTDGNAYIEFPYSEYPQTGNSANSINKLFDRTKLVVQDESNIPEAGIYTSKGTEFVCLDYGGSEQVLVVEPILTVDVKKYTMTKANLLEIETYANMSIVYVPGQAGVSEYRVKNSSSIIREENGIVERIEPADKENITITVSYPQELQPRRFFYNPTGSVDSYIGSSVILEKVVMHLASGETVTLTGTFSNDDRVNPTDSHVESVDFVFKELYGQDIIIGTTVEAKNIQTETVVYSTGTVKDKSAQHGYRIVPKEVFKVTYKNTKLNNVYLTQKDKVYEGSLSVVSAVPNKESMVTDLKLVWDDEKILQFFTGEIFIPALSPVIGGTISYKTSLGQEKDVAISSDGLLQFVNLEPGEKLEKVSITKQGTTLVARNVSDVCRFELEFTRAEIIKDFQADENTAKIKTSVNFSSKELGNEETLTTEGVLKLTADLTLKTPKAVYNTRGKVYQGDTYKLGVSRIDIPCNDDPIQSLPASLTLYAKLENTDRFVFQGSDNSNYQFEIVKKSDGQYLKITPREPQKLAIEYRIGQGYFATYLVPDLKFGVLPGATLGEVDLISDIYVDVSKLLEDSGTYKTEYCVNLHCEGLVEDNLNLTGKGDSDIPYMWKANTTGMVASVEILQQNLATVTVTPGLEEIYSNTDQIFYPTGRTYLNALAGIGSGSNELIDYKIRIPVPREGESVSYSYGGLTHEAVSEYNMFLRNEPRFVNYEIAYEASYRMEGGTEFLSATEVGNRWSDIVEIYINIAKLPAKGAMLVYLDLGAEDKGNVGLDDKYAYIAAQYEYNGGETLYGPRADYIYKDFQITGKTWIDNNENGIYNSGEAYVNNIDLTLLQNGTEAAADSYSLSVNRSNGNYTLTTYLYEDLIMRFDGLDSNKDGIKPTMVKNAINGSTSVFNREGEWTADLPAYFDENQTGYDLGIIKLPILTANNTQVGYKSEAQANVTVINQTNAPAVNSQIIYGEAVDTSIATVGFTGLIKGLKENSLTTATASVINSLGDKVTATYQIAVSDNKIPILTVHPWVAIEGDNIPDLWYGVTAEDPEEEYPAWKTFLLGANKSTRSIPADKKVVTIYTNADYTGEISLGNALSANGLYYVRYSVEDDKENLVTADTTLTVYGKMQGEPQIEKHYFASGATVRVDNDEIYYLDTTGSAVPVVVEDTSDWTLSEGVLTTKSQTATHPKISDVTAGVTAGNGRTFEAELKGAVDSKVNAMPVADYIALVDEANVKIGWLSATDGTYKHYELSGLGTPKEVLKTVENENGTVLTDTKTGSGVIEADTSIPGVYQYVKTAEVLEDYDNMDVSGNPIKNTASQNIKVTVVGKPVVTVPSAIYITPDKAADETFIKDKISASASFHDGTNPTAVIPANQIQYQFNQTGGKNTSVTVTAWGGRTDNLSDPISVEIVTREVPVLTLPDIHLRKGTEYGPENFADRVLTPEDEHNDYTYISNNLDTNTLGKYEAQYQVSDNLTGADADQSQIIYVHGIPEITATDKSLYAHQSTGEQALIDAVKLSAKAIVEYTKADGTTEIKTIPANELQYEVSDYVAGTAGRFKVTITANDRDYVPAGLAPMQVTKDVYVTVADRLFDVTFTTNSDNFHDRGTIDGGAGPVVNSTIYGHTAVIAVPAANEGYHFDGFKTLSQLKTTQELTLSDGTVIAAGNEIPVGSMLSIEQIQTIEIYGNTEFQAYFSATPVLNGKNIKLYVGETYNQADLDITVSDLDGDAQGIVVEDNHVDTSKAGTYQIKVSVSDNDQNYAEEYVYIQVYGKTELEGYDPIHIRQGQALSLAQLTGAIKATYEAPPAVPDSPWNVTSQPAVSEEVTFDLTGTVDTQVIALTKLTISAKGQIEGHEVDGQASAEKEVFVHGNPIITSDDGALYTHESTGQTVLIDLIKQTTAASIQYVEPDGSIRTETIAANKLNYEIKTEENYQPRTEGTYKVTISFNDTDYVPTGLQPVDAELLAAVIVSDKAYSVKFSINNDNAHHKGDYEGGISEFNTNAIHGNPVGRVPVPVESAGYHFDGFKTLTEFTTTDDIQLADGSTVLAGTQIPVGTMLTPAQLESLKIYDNLEFQAYFSASPVITGENLVLYEREAYSQDKLHIEVTDLDQNAQQPVIDDLHVDTNVAGTYQVKVTVNDVDGNQTVKYLYVQVVGKTEIIDIPDLHTRKDSTVTEEQLLENVKAVYAKPEEIPEEPWAEENKVNNGHAAITTAVEVHSYDVVNTDTVQKTQINLSAPGMIHGREMTGKADEKRNIYIHGIPVIVAYDNGIYTHQSTSDAILEQTVQTGIGTLERDAASAYVEYVQPDGSIKKVAIDPGKITYTVNQFIPLTAGDYSVIAKVDDFSVLAQAPAGLAAVSGEKAVTIVVADKMYSVMFEMGEHGGLEDPTKNVIAVAHGKKIPSPILAPEEGYKLDYWVDEAGNRISDISSVVVTANRKFTAEFKLKEFTVRFIGKKDRVIKTEIVKYGHDATPPTEDKDVKSNRFNGWSTSYTHITKDTDIYTTYWSKSGGGGPSGGGSFVPTGPGMGTTNSTTITEPGVPMNPFENLVTIGTNPVPTGNTEIPAYTGLPKTGDVSEGIKAHIGYQATLIDGTRALSEEEPLVGHQNGGLIRVFEEHADWRKCILHIILLIVSALEGIFYLLKRRRDRRLLEKLRKELEEEDK